MAHRFAHRWRCVSGKGFLCVHMYVVAILTDDSGLHVSEALKNSFFLVRQPSKYAAKGMAPLKKSIDLHINNRSI